MLETMVTHHPVERTTDAFSKDLSKALERLQTTLASVVDALPAEAPTAAALAKIVNVNRKIAWQVWRIIDAQPGELPLESLPGPVALEGFLKACTVQGVPSALCEPVLEASRRFDDLALLHGGGRPALRAMVRLSSASTLSSRAQESVRRQAYLANSEILGLQSHAIFGTAILAPGSQPGRIDDISLAGEIGVRRLRPDAVRVVAGLGFSNKSDDADPLAPKPLVQVPSDSGLVEPMIPRFTSARVRVAAHPSEKAQTRVELVESPVGKSGEVDFVLGQICRNVGFRFPSGARKRASFSGHILAPYAVYVQDLIIRKDLWRTIQPSVKVYSTLRGMAIASLVRDERDVLPVRTSIEHLGQGLGALRCEYIPRYEEIIDWACSQAAWNPEQFDTWRCTIMYPPMPSTIVVSVDLPQA